MLDEKLLEIIACPKCKGELEYTGEELICHSCSLAYPIRNDVPIMLIDEARNTKEEGAAKEAGQ
jgi:hypothetical protein